MRGNYFSIIQSDRTEKTLNKNWWACATGPGMTILTENPAQ